MNLDKANRWITLLANIGVLAGIVFLSLEINQSNRIAVQEARIKLTSEIGNLQQVILENQDLARVMSKLAAGGELTPDEEFQATSYAWTLLGQTAALNLTYENDFISDRVLQRYLRAQAAQIERVPGIVPYLAAAMDSLGMTRGVSPAFDSLIDTVESYQ